ncbi:uncharacterized protein [Coffea arabica]|uniref:Voltage-gated hydrogen channel 1 n=1 Tax=Coffea arabica TaxID=13443 RepID=A0A6P6WK00_COFAR|nr:uncharacterized protein LOC113733792 [Coffea arabica]
MSSDSQVRNIEISLQNLIKSWNRRQKRRIFVKNGEKQEVSRSSWRAHLSNFLESTYLRIFTIFLLVIDLILTSLELSSSFLSCPKKKNFEAEEVWFHWVGIAILSLLCVKSLALFVGLGRSFILRPGYVLDCIVVMVALILEAFLERKGGGLVVVVSLWRVLRVVESAFELSDEAIEAQIELIVCQFEALKHENARLMDIIVEKDMIIEKLEEEIDKSKHG